MQYNVLTLLTTMVAMTGAVSIHVCTSKDYTGECTDVTFPNNECANLPFNDAVSSFKLNNYVCSFYTDRDCTGTSATFSADETNLRDGTWNDQVTSVKC
ncbi:hypothetical protein FOVG_18305 [Fusarium oxysporum f. sp. pisi HDV247]|uniref:Uncharacterized protein n=2 Tax=Fusarium oxysporum TaxID=5507 RepID=A0A420M8H7_FUSOX|nr:hypothetical protein FOVG_18305 [Fusarium oxysporum f. sp. pisi HDV247]KAH7191563.1 hypothetical protein BKA60DRAFT_642734 [Fusarium oxysporum]RKK58968.1 hypothetical protein BFJ69_g17351 [Fusarium oxysporum]RKK74265.1 hypothetical protein BFJ71_g17302 [Fusarium oxysporum]